MPAFVSLDAIRRKVVAAVDARHAEPISVRPQREKVSRFKPVGDDPGRYAFDIMAVLRVSSDEEDLGGQAPRSFSTQIASGEASLVIDDAAWPAGRTIQAGDVIVATSRPGAPEFTADLPEPRSAGRLKWKLIAR